MTAWTVLGKTAHILSYRVRGGRAHYHIFVMVAESTKPLIALYLRTLKPLNSEAEMFETANDQDMGRICQTAVGIWSEYGQNMSEYEQNIYIQRNMVYWWWNIVVYSGIFFILFDKIFA